MEAGYRCAIPTCHQTPVEVAHIVPWEKVQEHAFDNLIALCPTCHARYDKGEIERKAMEQFKANLSILNGRYCDLERRVLDIFAKHTEGNLIWLSGDFTILLLNLIADGLLEDTGQTSGVFIAGVPSRIQYRLTQKGRRFIEEWLSAKQLE